ncbi:MAG: hypothetical protein JOY93_03290 [Acidobacteriales bacterium]|nr:hypothetical protein [Terriglobales bacterium]
MQEVEEYLAQHRPEWNAKQRALVARLCEGAVGRANSFDLESFEAARSNALSIINSAIGRADHSELFRVTETYRAGGDGRAKFETLLRTLYSLLRDLLAMKSAVPEFIRNTDIESQLRKIADNIDLDWIATASDRLSEVERGMRRNLLRPLSLDAFAASLEP